MESHTDDQLWQDVHKAYEEHDLQEAGRLLGKAPAAMDCSRLADCGDIDYFRWLLNQQMLVLTAGNADSWPGLQEKQLQCNALEESARPRCILHGEWDKE